jgi:hypothetical protein
MSELEGPGRSLRATGGAEQMLSFVLRATNNSDTPASRATASARQIGTIAARHKGIPARNARADFAIQST